MQLKNKQLKIVGYQGIGDPPNPRNVVAYKRYHRVIVFSGLRDGTDGGRGSTCNFAEDIVRAIVEKEGVHYAHCTFFDLWTRTSYGNDFELGDYSYYRLRLEWDEASPRFYCTSWFPCDCASEILGDFAELIWHDALVGRCRNVA